VKEKREVVIEVPKARVAEPPLQSLLKQLRGGSTTTSFYLLKLFFFILFYIILKNNLDISND
jgi:hypothetical protein